MKIHTKKKAFRRAWKEQARKGMMNGSDGIWKVRANFQENSMVRDFHPQHHAA